MLKRQKHADIPGTGIQGANESDQEQGPERRHAGKGQSGAEHEQRRTKEEAPVMEAMPPGSDGQRGECRTQQGGRTQDAYIQRPKAQR